MPFIITSHSVSASIKFSSACCWGHNWQNAISNSFHWNVDKFVRFFVFLLLLFFFMYVANYVSGMWSSDRSVHVPTEDTLKSRHVQRAIVWTFFILSHPLVSPFTRVLRFAGKPRSPRMVCKASVMQATPGCPGPIFPIFWVYSYFLLFVFLFFSWWGQNL